jgi:putative salt-induced outer membrane protein YdiY
VLKSRLFVVVCLYVLSQFAVADQITLKNGDRLTGTIISADSTSLKLKTDYADTLTIKWDAVQAVSSDQSLYLTSKTGQTVVGTVSTTDGKFQVATKDQGTVTVAKDDVKNVRSESEQKAYGAWGGSLDSGLSLSRGNSETTNFTLGATATRTTEKDTTSAFLNSLYSRDKTNGVSVSTANAIHAGIRFDYNLSDKIFAFVFTDFDRDRFQDLNLRNVIGGGLGYHLIKTSATNLDLSAGATFDQEYYSTLTRKSGELLAGESLDHKFSGVFSIKERLEFYPNVSELGQYRIVFDTTAVTKMSKSFSLELDASDRYITNPVNGLKGNDLLFTTGLRYAFGASKGL